MDIGVIITGILSGSVGVALVTAIKELIIWKGNRRHEVEDEENKLDDKVVALEKQMTSINEKLDTLTNKVEQNADKSQEFRKSMISSNRLLFCDRIRTIASKCIQEKSISYETRKLLHDLWEEYHTSWEGNGDLNLIMQEINELPLKSDLY